MCSWRGGLQVTARAFAEAAMECSCEVDAEVMAGEVEEVVAVAHAAAKSAVCVSGVRSRLRRLRVTSPAM